MLADCHLVLRRGRVVEAVHRRVIVIGRRRGRRSSGEGEITGAQGGSCHVEERDRIAAAEVDTGVGSHLGCQRQEIGEAVDARESAEVELVDAGAEVGDDVRIVARRIDEPVGAEAAGRSVVAGTVRDDVVALAGIHRVIAGAGRDAVRRLHRS